MPFSHSGPLNKDSGIIRVCSTIAVVNIVVNTHDRLYDSFPLLRTCLCETTDAGRLSCVPGKIRHSPLFKAPSAYEWDPKQGHRMVNVGLAELSTCTWMCPYSTARTVISNCWYDPWATGHGLPERTDAWSPLFIFLDPIDSPCMVGNSRNQFVPCNWFERNANDVTHTWRKHRGKKCVEPHSVTCACIMHLCMVSLGLQFFLQPVCVNECIYRINPHALDPGSSSCSVPFTVC